MLNSKEEKPKTIIVYKAEANLMKVSSLPSTFVDDAIERNTIWLYDEKNCDKCQVVEQRHSEVCDACESFIGKRQMAKIVRRGENSYLSVPQGGVKRFENLLSDHNLKAEVIEKYGTSSNFHDTVKLTQEPRDWQKEALEVTLEKRRGIVVAPPRSGKTFLAVMVSVSIQKKTLIIASQIDWLEQFRKTYVGAEGEKAFTDIDPSRVGYFKSEEDVEKLDVCLATFSQFMSYKGKKLLESVRSKFGIIIADEVHYTSALATSRVLARFNSEFMLGLTGTPTRKRSSEDIIFRLLVGAVIYKAKVDMLKPELVLLETNVTINLPKGGNRLAYTRFIGKLETEKKRVKIICEYVAKAIGQGHSVMLPVQRAKSVKAYLDGINSYFDEAIAVRFDGTLSKGTGGLRELNLKKIKSGEARAIVGNISLLSTGLNIPRLSMLIDRVTITSNIPKTEQRVSRILTPWAKKKQPKLVMVMDDCDIQRATARNEYFNAIVPRFHPIASPEIRSKFANWLNKKKITSPLYGDNEL